MVQLLRPDRDEVTSAADLLPVAPRETGWTRLGRFLFRYRDFLFPVLLGAPAFLTRPRPFLGDWRRDVWLDAFGLLVALAGQALRAAVIGLEYIERGGRNKRVYASRLVTGGLFAHSRNPLYLGNLLIVAGLCLVHAGPWVLAIALPGFTVAYHAIMCEEERFLAGEFGAEYEAYRRRVPRLGLRLAGLRSTVRSMPFRWKRLVRKEYGTTFAWLTAFLALIAWERVTAVGRAAADPTLRVLVALWIGFGVLYLTARLLKKTGRLGHD